MTWKTVRKYATYEEANEHRNKLIQEGLKVKVKKYGGKTPETPTRFEVKVAQTDS